MFDKYDKKRIVKRLFKYRHINLLSNCWEWTSAKTRNNYGVISMFNVKYRVHRLSANIWLNFNLNSTLCVLHHCDNRICFNPKHLFIGTESDNTKDMLIKGRQYSKLSENDIHAIRYLYKIFKNNKRKYNQYKLAEIFKVTQCTIGKIINNIHWTHII